jgi:exonuclease SbcC
VGLSFETFTASVLLRQNESDVLLTINASSRHDMLTQLVNLSAYVRLCERADEKRKRLEQEASIYERQLQSIAPVDDAYLASLSAHIEQATTRVQEMLAQLGRLSAIKVKAERWNHWQNDYLLVEQSLREIHAILDQAERVECRASRLTALQQVLPSLQFIAVKRREIAEKEQSITQYREDLRCWGENQVRACMRKDSAQELCNDLTQQRDGANKDRELAQAALGGLQEDVNMLQQLAGIRSQIEERQQLLSSFPVDLEQQLSALQQEVDGLKELEVALPWLEHYAEARTVWHQASLLCCQTQRDAEALAAQIALKQDEKRAAEDRLQTVQQEASEAQQYLTECNTLLTVAKKNLRSFQEVDGQAKCRYCGQPLTPQHLEDERTRLAACRRERSRDLARC